MKAELYVQILPEFNQFYPDKVRDIRVGKVTKRPPTEIEANARLVKVVLDVPAEHFITQAVEVEAPAPPAIRAVS